MAGIASPVRARSFSLETKTVLLVVVLFLLAFVVAYPLVLIFFNSFTVTPPGEPIRQGFDNWRTAFTDPKLLKAFWNTGLVWVARQGIGFPIAILIAWLIARTNMPGGRWLEFFFWVSFFLPSLAVIQGWLLMLHPSTGLLNTALEKLPFIDKGPFNMYSFWGIVWAHLGGNTIALKVMLLTPAFRNMDATLEEASRISGASSLRTLVRVVMPILTPALVVMLALSTIHSFQAAEVELVLGTRINFFVFGSQIYSLLRFSEPAQYGSATAMGVMVLLVVAPIIFFQRWSSMRRRYTTVTGQFKPQVLHLRQWKWPAFGFVFFIAMALTVFPVAFLVMGSFMKLFGFFDVPGGPWTLANWTRVLQDTKFLSALKNSLYLGFGGATISVVFFSLVAYVIVRSRSRLSAAVDYLTWFPLALPGVLLALVWLWIILGVSFFRPLYGTLWPLMIVSGISGLTLGVAIIKSNFLQLGTDLEEASYTAGAGWWTTMRKVVLPLMVPILMVVWVINFVSAVNQSVVPSLLGTNATRPLASFQLELLLTRLNEAAAVVGVILIMLTVGVAIVARSFGLRVGLRI